MARKRWWEVQTGSLLDRANIAYWLPILENSAIDTPLTRIIETDVDLLQLLDNKTPIGFDVFIENLVTASHLVAFGPHSPVFLRTGWYSGKHLWGDTCYVKSISKDEIVKHVALLVDESLSVDVAGLPIHTWAVRDFVPLRHSFTAFNGMPVARERRLFIGGGKVLCHHPYWPEMAIEQPSRSDWKEVLRSENKLNKEESLAVLMLSEVVAETFKDVPGRWSLDVAQVSDDDSWIVIDMAPAELSYHWVSCPNSEKFRVGE